MRYLLTITITLFLATSATASGRLTLADWHFLDASLTATEIGDYVHGTMTESYQWTKGLSNDLAAANGALLMWGRYDTDPRGDESDYHWLLERIETDGTIVPLVYLDRIRDDNQPPIVVSHPETGSAWIIADIESDDSKQLWLVTGLPSTSALPPGGPGDVAPGEEDISTEPPTWRIAGDGRIDIGDVVALLRTTVGLNEIEAP